MSDAALRLARLGLARQKRWRRPPHGDSRTEVPVFVRFSAWFVTTLVVPNILYGALVLSRRGEGLDYLSAWLSGLIIAAIHGGFALAARLGRRSRA